MADTTTPGAAPETLPDLLTRRARGMSDRRLAIDASAGLLVAGAAAVFQPPGWVPLLGAAVAIGASGLWGILDRELVERTPSPSAHTKPLRVARTTAAAVGGAGAFLLLLSLLAVVLGRWIS